MKLNVYKPNFQPEQQDLADFIKAPKTKETQAAILKKVQEQPLLQASSKPLTEEEVKLLLVSIQEKQDKAKQVLSRIQGIKNYIDSACSEQKIVVSDPIVLKAIKKVFGIRSNEITYAMYKEALQAKQDLQSSESDAYVSGSWNQ